jgi:hypothetical protein
MLAGLGLMAAGAGLFLYWLLGETPPRKHPHDEEAEQ